MLLVNAVIGLVQLIIAIIFSVVALYIGFFMMSKITKNIDEEKELAKGNVAVGIIVASVFVAIALVVQSGVSGLSVGIARQRRPIRRQQRADLGDLQGGEASEHVGQVRFRIDVPATATREDRVGHGTAPPGVGMADEEPPFPSM